MTWLLVTRSPVAQLALLGLVPRHPYSAVPFPSNWELWRNFPDAPQQSSAGTVIVLPERRIGPELNPRLYSWAARALLAGTTLAIAGWRGAQYDGIVASAACEHFERGPGVSLMMIVMLVVGIGCLLAGLLAIGFGIPVKEFSFGNTLILAGAVTACTGLIMLGLWVVVGELKNIARRLGSGGHPDVSGPAATALQPAATAARAIRRRRAVASCSAATSRHLKMPIMPKRMRSPRAAPAPWQEEAAARTARATRRAPVPQPAETAPAAKQRRNLLFSSTSRKERERAQARTADPSATDLHSAPAAAPPAPNRRGAPGDTSTMPGRKSERSRSADAPPRRSGRAPSTFTEATAARPATTGIRRLREPRISRR